MLKDFNCPLTPKSMSTLLSKLKQRPVLNLPHFPRLAVGKHDKPAVHELLENVPHDLKIEHA